MFEKCKLSLRGGSAPQSPTDPRLRWVTGFMQKHGLSCSAMAKRLKISDATLNRLLVGKYNGNVERMLGRIDTYRTETEKPSAAP